MTDQFGMKEVQKILVIEKLMSHSLTIAEAAKELDLSPRQVKRLKKAFSKEGAETQFAL